MRFTALFTMVLIATILVAGCSPSRTEDERASATKEKSQEPESRVKRGTNGAILITLDAATQKRMGLEIAVLKSAELKPELKSFGRVLDTSPMAALVAELTAAEATSNASRAELKRLKTLAGQNNASERSLEAAEAAAAKDTASVESVRLKLLANWGSAISERKDLPELIRSFSTLSSCLVEINIPAGQRPTANPTGARLLTFSNPTKSIPAQLLGPAPMVDPQMQGQSFLLLVNPNPEHLTPGAAVTAWLTLPGEPESGVSLPQDAVVRYNGVSWVYVQRTDEGFERLEVNSELPLDRAFFVRKDLHPGDKVVTTGAQQLLSEELKSSISED